MPASARPAPSRAHASPSAEGPLTERPGDAPGPHPSDAVRAAVSGAQLAALAPLHGWTADLLEAWGDGASLWTDFLAARVRSDVGAQHRALRCGSAADLARIQADWVQEAVNDWRDVAARLSEVGRRAGGRQPGGATPV